MPVPLYFAAAAAALLVYALARRWPFPAEPAPRPDWAFPLERRLQAALAEVRWKLTPWQFRGFMTLDAALCGALALGGYIDLPWPLAALAGFVLPPLVLALRISLRRRQLRRAAGAGLPLLAGLLAVQPDAAKALRVALPHLASPLQEEVAEVLRQIRAERLALPDALQLAAMRCGDDLWLHGLAALVAVPDRPPADLAAGVARLAVHHRTVTELEG